MKHGKQKLANNNTDHDSLSSLDRALATRRDIFGRTLLHNACICGDAKAVQQLLANPHVDVTAVESESGSSALHLALAAGSLHCAQLLIKHSRELLRLKDRDGCPAFETALYYHKWLKTDPGLPSEYFSFGSNTNHTLGFPDSDDRQTPETVKVLRPVATDIRSSLAPVRVVDCAIGGYHTAILTSDEDANLYVCGVSSRGRLGLGPHVSTQFTPTLVASLASEKIVSVGVGKDHTACVTAKGVVYTWGCNRDSQLGYATGGATGEEQLQMTPRRVGGPTLKKAHITHVTCSNVHTVCWRENTSDMYVWGANNGQMGGMAPGQDCAIPTMVALVPGKISAVCASDYYTACIIDESYIQVYMNGGHFRIFLPAPGGAAREDSQSGFDVFKPRLLVNRPQQLYASAGGPTICVSSLGHVYELPLQRFLNVKPALVARQMPVTALWVPRRDYMVATHAAVGDDGSVIICTSSGSAWKRERKENRLGGGTLKEYKFSRIPKVTNAYKVACDPLFRSFAALRYATQVEAIDVDIESLEFDVAERELMKRKITYLSLDGEKEANEEFEDSPNLGSLNWLVEAFEGVVSGARKGTGLEEEAEMMGLNRFEENVMYKAIEMTKTDPHRGYDCELVCENSTVKLPCHTYMLRSTKLKSAVEQNVPLNCSLLTLVILHHYLYNDNVLSVWTLGGGSSIPRQYVEAKNELLALAKEFELSSLVSKLSFGETVDQLPIDMAKLCSSEQGDMAIMVDGGETLHAHRFILTQQSEFFQSCLSQRWADDSKDVVDLCHLPAASVRLCLRFMYTHNLESLFDQTSSTKTSKDFIVLVSQLLTTADELLLTPLKEFCELVLSELVTVKNTASLLVLASAYNCNKLMTFMLSYICVNMECLLEGGFLSAILADEELFGAIDHHYRVMTGREIVIEEVPESSAVVGVVQLGEVSGGVTEDVERAVEVTEEKEPTRVALVSRPSGWVESFLDDFDGHNELLCRVAPGSIQAPDANAALTPHRQSFAALHRNSKSEETRPSISPMSSPDLRGHNQNDDVFEFELDECPAEQRKRHDSRHEDRRGSHSEWREVKVGSSSVRGAQFSSSPFGKSPMAGSPMSVSPNHTSGDRRRSSFATAASGVPLTPGEIRFNLKQQIEKDSDAVYWPTLGGPWSFNNAQWNVYSLGKGTGASNATPGSAGSPATWGKSSVSSTPVGGTPASGAGSALSDLFSVTPPSNKLSQKERRRLLKQQQEESLQRAQEKEKQAAEGPWKVKKKASVAVSPFESTPSASSSKAQSKTPSRVPSRTPSRAGVTGSSPTVGVGSSTVGNSNATATSSFASDFYASSQPATALSLADIRERQERSTQKAKNVKTIEEIQQEEMFQKWWDAEVARNKEEEMRGSDGGARGTPSKSQKRPNKKKGHKGSVNASNNGGGAGNGSQDDSGKRQRPRPREQIKV
ncbi:BTB/POZ domain-containing protein 1 [Yarrowia sp. E02]|nr:BTB/POZ domain-containing protein 1 [Yarrowia sp. E02]